MGHEYHIPDCLYGMTAIRSYMAYDMWINKVQSANITGDIKDKAAQQPTDKTITSVPDTS